MDWDLARWFLAVAEAERLGAASRALNASPATVSRKIAELERFLGAPLLVRHGRGYRLSEFGREAVRLLQAPAAALDDALGALCAADGARRPVVRVNTVESLAVFWLPGQVEPLAAEVPDVDLDIRSDFSLVDPRFGEADIVLRLGQKGADPLVGRSAGSFAYGLFDAPGSNRMVRYVGAMADTPVGAWSRSQLEGAEAPTVACDSVSSAVNVLRRAGGRAALPAFIGRAEGWRQVVAQSGLMSEIMILRRGGLRRDDPRQRVYRHLLARLRATDFRGAGP
ncbi:LysR family transcriptional regulator [Phenylobacterium sp.]|uniref:LysR family transcriptional regulator n=1 Tax=Phenylobacterium sp. TaxID=1871053 RepID=UPI0035B20CE3